MKDGHMAGRTAVQAWPVLKKMAWVVSSTCKHSSAH